MNSRYELTLVWRDGGEETVPVGEDETVLQAAERACDIPNETADLVARLSSTCLTLREEPADRTAPEPRPSATTRPSLVEMVVK